MWYRERKRLFNTFVEVSSLLITKINFSSGTSGREQSKSRKRNKHFSSSVRRQMIWRGKLFCNTLQHPLYQNFLSSSLVSISWNKHTTSKLRQVKILFVRFPWKFQIFSCLLCEPLRGNTKGFRNIFLMYLLFYSFTSQSFEAPIFFRMLHNSSFANEILDETFILCLCEGFMMKFFN